MKKLTVLFISLLLVFGLAACSADSDRKNNSDRDTTTNSKTQTSAQSSDTSKDSATSAAGADESNTKPEDSSEPTAATEKKTLVVFYSASGNTEGAANYIAAATNADILELVPVNDYSSDDLNYQDDDSRVVYEHDHPKARDIELVKNTVENWDEYDTVFIGYPIWWQIAAWPVDGFVKANDFTGKTVIPFCTSASSGLGDSGKLLADMAGTGNWLEGQRFSSSVSESTVKEWIDSLNLGD